MKFNGTRLTWASHPKISEKIRELEIKMQQEKGLRIDVSKKEKAA